MAANEKVSAGAALRQGDKDQASEDFVGAAINEFRAALCHYALGDLSNPDYSKQDARNGALNYALRLNDAAQDLADAAANERATDYAEILAALMLSTQFFAAAKKALEDFEAGAKKKGITLDPAALTKIKDAKDTADTGQTNSKTLLDSHLK